MDVIKAITLEEEMRKNTELKVADIQLLREWCEKQPHLPQISDSELALFLHSNYYRLEPTKNTIENYYTMRTHIPEFFMDRDPLHSQEVIKISKVLANMTLEGKTKDGYTIFYGSLLDFDPANYVFAWNMKLLCMVIDQWLYTHGTNEGHIFLINLKGLSLGYVARFNPMAIKKFIYYLQDGLPVRLKGLHFVNTTAAMDVFLNIAKPFMKKCLLDILHLHQDVKGIEKFNVPLEILPNDLGGKAGSQEELFVKSIENLKKFREWFIEDEKTRRVDETLRAGNAKTATDLFGMEGSFKKIDFD